MYVLNHNCAESTMVRRRVSFFTRNKKTFSHQNTKSNALKWSQKLKHSLFMCNSSKFIYIVFSVSRMCCKMSLHGMHGRAAKYPVQKPSESFLFVNKTNVRYMYVLTWSIMNLLYTRNSSEFLELELAGFLSDRV